MVCSNGFWVPINSSQVVLLPSTFITVEQDVVVSGSFAVSNTSITVASQAMLNITGVISLSNSSLSISSSSGLSVHGTQCPHLSLLELSCVIFIMFLLIFSRSSFLYASDVGEIGDLDIGDGSSVVLNSSSPIRVTGCLNISNSSLSITVTPTQLEATNNKITAFDLPSACRNGEFSKVNVAVISPTCLAQASATGKLDNSTPSALAVVVQLQACQPASSYLDEPMGSIILLSIALTALSIGPIPWM